MRCCGIEGAKGVYAWMKPKLAKDDPCRVPNVNSCPYEVKKTLDRLIKGFLIAMYFFYLMDVSEINRSSLR